MQSSDLLLYPDVCGLLERRCGSLTEHWTPIASESTESQRGLGDDEEGSDVEGPSVQEVGGAEVCRSDQFSVLTSEWVEKWWSVTKIFFGCAGIGSRWLEGYSE